MKTKNFVELIGFLGRDPAVQRTSDGSFVHARLSVATTDRWTAAGGERKERTEWHRVVLWGPLGERAAQLLRTGSLVQVEGHLRSSVYDKTVGSHTIPVTGWEIHGSEFRLLEKRDSETSDTGPAPGPQVDDIPL